MRSMHLATLMSLCTLSLTTIACGDKDGGEDDDGDTGSDVVDADGDGFPADEDCDDSDPAVFPEAEETCNGVDDDCDDEIDEDAVDATTWYADSDTDGFGDPDATTTACEAPAGHTTDATDCDDGDADVNPDAEETCNGIDDDCNDVVDDDSAVDASTWYADTDEDGYGDLDATTTACDAPDGYTDDATDCDDGAGTVFPGADETCNGIDDDCDDATSEDGMASWEAADGTFTDWTDAVTGSADAGAAVTLDEDGTLWFCDGDYYVNIVSEADTTVASLSADPDAVTLDGAGTGTVVRTQTAATTLTVQDLTLTNGLGNTDPTLGLSSGGAVACSDSSVSGTAVEITGSYLTGNEATYGGAIMTLGCDTRISDTLVWDNYGSAAAGGSLHWDGDHTWSDVQVYENLATREIGGSYWANYTSSDTLAISLDEVLFQDNYAPILGGVGWTTGDITWSGTDATSSGALGNMDDGYFGGVLYGSGTTSLVADTLDLGEEGTADDNDPYDVYDDVGDNILDYGDDVSFSCDDSGCGSSGTATIGGADNSGSGTYILLNTIEAEADGVLETVSMYLDGNSACTLDWYIFSSETGPDGSGGTMTWTYEWSEESVAMTDDDDTWFSTSPDFSFEEGVFYAVGAGWECSSGSVGYHWSTTRGDTAGDAGWGSASWYGYDIDETTVTADHDFTMSTDDALWYMDFEYTTY